MPSLVRLLPTTALLVAALCAPSQVDGSTPRLSVSVAHQLLHPGEKQTVAVVSAPRRSLTLSVTFPNGATLMQHGSSSAKGRLRFTFVQPANSLSRNNRVATVDVSLDQNPTRSARALYRIAFAPIDLVVPTEPVREYSAATVWVHTQSRHRLTCGPLRRHGRSPTRKK